MVKQDQKEKTSSRRLGHQFSTSIICGYHPPLTIETRMGSEVESDLMEPGSTDKPGGYVILGRPGEKRFNGESAFPEAPHISFANLQVERPEALVAFTKRYGVLKESFLEKEPEEVEAEAVIRRYGGIPFKGPLPNTFKIDSFLLQQLQERLRGAWDKDWKLHKPYVGGMQEQIEFGTTVTVRSGGSVVLTTADPWTFICFLFLQDFVAGRVGLCGNPDCPAPYFRKKRRTQKYCEQGPCVQYAQRQYSLDWWNRKGKKIREKKAKSARKETK